MSLNLSFYVKKIGILSPVMILVLNACGSDQQSKLSEAWNHANRPEIMGTQYEKKLNALALEGKSSGNHWTGDYWPSFRGGIAQRWQQGESLTSSTAYPLLSLDELTQDTISRMSPAEKYDLYAGDSSFSLTRSERQRTQALRAIAGTDDFQSGFRIPEWEGLCHGWAPATLLFKEPKPVTLKSPAGLSIPFASADIKALLSLMLHEGRGSKIQMLGQRCESDSALDSEACRDTNAGSFHLVLSNELGRRGEAFVMDVTRSSQVWNQGVVSYRSKLSQLLEQASPGSAEGTRFEVDVKTEIDYLVESPSQWEAQGSRGVTRKALYSYRLELNEKGEIIGGAWLSHERPDFLWRQSKPQLSARLKLLSQIYKASTGDSLELESNQGTVPEGLEPTPACAPNDPWCF